MVVLFFWCVISAAFLPTVKTEFPSRVTAAAADADFSFPERYRGFPDTIQYGIVRSADMVSAMPPDDLKETCR